MDFVHLDYLANRKQEDASWKVVGLNPGIAKWILLGKCVCHIAVKFVDYISVRFLMF